MKENNCLENLRNNRRRNIMIIIIMMRWIIRMSMNYIRVILMLILFDNWGQIIIIILVIISKPLGPESSLCTSLGQQYHYNNIIHKFNLPPTLFTYLLLTLLVLHNPLKSFYLWKLFPFNLFCLFLWIFINNQYNNQFRH